MNYSIDPTSIKSRNTRRGVAFKATLLQDGVAVALVENEGNGGGTWACNQAPNFDNKTFQAKAIKISGGEEFYLEDLMDIAEGV